MTLEFENPPLLSNVGLNSSYNNDAEFTSSFERVTAKPKKTTVISVARKESFLFKEKEEKNIEMSDRYSDDYDSYEDDFDNPDRNSPGQSKQQSRRYSRSSRRSQTSERSSSTPPPKYRSRSKKASTRRDSFASYRSTYTTNRGPSKPKMKKSHSAASKVTSKTTGSEQSSMMRRVLSANRHKVSRLHNIVEELQQEVDELKSENKSLQRVSHRQEKEIRKIDNEEASLPILLQRHSAEMRTLKQRLRRNQEVLSRKDKESHERDKEIQKLRDKVKNYRELSQDKKLEERAALAKKLQNIEDEMASKDKKILDLEKAITLKDKMRQREMKEQRERYRQAKEELKRVQEDFRSLRERLQEKERELDEKNIYHQLIIQKKKRGVTFPALPATTSDNPAITNTAEGPADAKGKHPNVFLTNAPSDSGSVITDKGKDIVHNSVQADIKSEKSTVSEVIKPSVFEADRRDEGEEVRLRKEAEERKRRAEEERRRRKEEEEEERKRKAEEEENRRKREEDEKRKREEEELMKHREEQQKRQEEEDKKRLEAEAETRRKKDLLLARMRAIDIGNEKTNDVAPTEAVVKDVTTVENKPKKLPIFLQSESTANKKLQQTKPITTSVSEGGIFSDTSGERKRSSARSKDSSYSYDFKQTVENLHQGLPAHASLEDVKEAAADSSEDLSFGGYKPTLGRRAGGRRAESKNKDEVSFGGYNPSFGAKKETSRKNSGLDFGNEKKVTTEKDQNSVIFGEHKPSLGGVTSKPSGSLSNGDIFGDRGVAARGRRPREFPGKGKSVFGDEILSLENKPAGSPLFGNKSLNKDNSSYPWENKIDVALRTSGVKEQEDSLLPRRRNLQNIGKSAEKNIPVVDNALNDIDDEIEEVIL
ncbi:lebercilin-like isoform X2 [Acropora millepora]|uniref:lebercilin-like isoform X2 n=1 Tax=Acropora millepora TaxID=45264 RepID=UPI001CF4CCF8|nr:lebercilin-like isoform X2 [Acropora millepora]